MTTTFAIVGTDYFILADGFTSREAAQAYSLLHNMAGIKILDMGRGDDRWLAANAFFQRADYERRLISRNTSAILASDWASFGHKNYSLEEYLQAEVASATAYRIYGR